MEGAIRPGTLVCLSSTTMFRGGGRRKTTENLQSGINLIRKNPNRFIKTHRLETAAGINEVPDAAEAEITWQIVVGALAGVTPFVVAGIEFSKRIIAQRKCEVCGGSGLILRDKNYFRCPGCGGFLPWQSWKRFFFWLKSSFSFRIPKIYLRSIPSV